jgi:hypothetical protein
MNRNFPIESALIADPIKEEKSFPQNKRIMDKNPSFNRRENESTRVRRMRLRFMD